MAAANADLSDWADMKLIKAGFQRGVKKASGGKKLTAAELNSATLTAFAKAVPKAAYDKLNMGIFAAAKKDAKGRLSFETFATQEFFKKMAGKDEKLAKAWCCQMAKMEEDLQTEEEKKAARPKKEGGVVNRLTDTSKYTGAHKERFGEDGKGKGIEGREERADNSGYVGEYKGADTFGKGGKKGADSAANDITKRLTDTSKYTGAHKERFDESGKGKGSSGREDKADNTGYVGNYKGKGSYGKK